MEAWFQLCYYYSGWTIDDVRKLTLEEYNIAMDTLNKIKKDEAKREKGGMGRGK